MTERFLVECATCRAKINLAVEASRLLAGGLSGPGNESYMLVGAGVPSTSDTARPTAARSLEESFIVLDNSSASQAPPSTSSTAVSNGQAFEAPADLLTGQIRALTSIFELASTDTGVDQPLCMECAKTLYGELKLQLHEAEREILAYRDAVQELRTAMPPVPLAPTPSIRTLSVEDDPSQASEPSTSSPAAPQGLTRTSSHLQSDHRAALREELQLLLQEEAKERKRLESLERDYGAALDELRTLEGESLRLDQLEDSYWRELNRFQHELQRHVEERDGMLAKVDRARHHLEALRKTNVFNDVFRIWYDGQFGTISGFRLGRTPQVQVPWEEINSALGQCVLLLQALASACRLEFSGVRLVPMASRSRIEERGRTLDLYGPVNKVNIISGFDQGLVCYVECLKQLADFLRARDLQMGKSPDEAFMLSYAIEGDKVGGASVRYCMNKDQKWTKALKFMLADLKLCLNCVASARAEK